jgi:PAS domain S-box-containing protein
MQLSVKHTHSASTALYDEMEKHAGIGTWIYDRHSGICSFSKNFCRIAGMSKEKPFEKFDDILVNIHPDDRYLLTQTEESLVANAVIPECEYRIISGAKTRYVRQYGKKLQDMEDEEQSFGFWQDITRWRIRDNSFSFLESLIDANTDGIIVLDTQYKVLFWNRQSEVYTGIMRDHALHKKITDILPSLDRPHLLSAMSNAIKGLSSYIEPDQYFEINGYYETHFVPVRSGQGQVTAVLLLLHDVAHRIKAENLLKQKNRELRLRNAELQVFSYIASHDFKDPIARIYTAIELLVSRGGQSKENDKRYLRQIQGPLQRIRLLADDIAQFSRLDNTQSSFNEIDLNQALTLALKRLEVQLESTSITIDASVLPRYQGHFSMISKFFQHIIGTAIASKRANIPLLISISASEVSGQELKHENVLPEAHYLVLRIADNGGGLRKVFAGEEFALCEKIAELHGGFITDETIKGTSTTVCCYLQQGLAQHDLTDL